VLHRLIRRIEVHADEVVLVPRRGDVVEWSRAEIAPRRRERQTDRDVQTGWFVRTT
jgi:hypothetical protein